MSFETVTIGPCTLIRGDARDVLDVGAYDSIVTDAPYGINGGSGGDAKDYGKGNYNGSWEDTPQYIESVIVPAFTDALRYCESAAITPGNRCLRLYPKARDIGCFWTPAACTHGPWGMTTFQPILYYGKDWRAGRGALPSGIQVTERSEHNGHPCPKPMRPWTWLVDKVCPPEGIVLDPFMGSGTTGVACIKTGRQFIGIEIEPKYFEIAKRRITKAWREKCSELPFEKPEAKVQRELIACS